MTDDDKALCEALENAALAAEHKEDEIACDRAIARIRELSAGLECAQSECLEQARIIGIATERELALSAELDTVRKLARDMAVALDEATTDLMAEIDARSAGELTRRINRDKSLVKDYRKALTAWQEHEGKQP